MTKPTAEDLVVAVLHKVGEDVRIRDGKLLYGIFDKAARKSPKVFGIFRAHPQYYDCPRLKEVLYSLDIGGSIERFNAASQLYQASKSTREEYGSSKYASLSRTTKNLVDEVAENIRDAFRSGATTKKPCESVCQGQCTS